MSIRSIWRKLVTWGINKRTIKWTVLYMILKWVLTFTLIAYLIRVDKWKPIYWSIFPIIAVGLLYYLRKKSAKKTR